LLAELIGVDLEPAVLGPLEGERECTELLSRAEPDEAALADLDIGLEYAGMGAAGPAVHPVRGDDEVGIPEGGILLHLMLEDLEHAELPRALLQQAEEPLAADAAESVAAAQEPPSAEMHGDIVPVVKAREDGGVRLRIGGEKVSHRLVGKDHAPAEGIVGTVTLVYFDPCGRQGFAQQYGGVEPGRPAAHADDSPHADSTSFRTRIARVHRMLYWEVLQVSINISPETR
jgi:hypothetical protein